MELNKDNRIVLTLDAGGTNFVFNAMQGGKEVVKAITKPSNGDDLEKCLQNMVEGFKEVKDQLTEEPAAISFAFPGPADYKNGIIGDLNNLTGFRGGVALGPMLEKKFDIPVFINNDGDLYAYGESIAGFLPMVNKALKDSGSPKEYKNLVGITLGTGFGAGIVHDGNLLLGDNIVAGEVWLMSNRYYPQMNAEECVSIRAVKRFYSIKAHIPFEETPEPVDIYNIGIGKMEGDQKAAIEAYAELGKILGDTLANLVTLTDGLIVIGGGVSGAKSLIVPAMIKEMNSQYTDFDGNNKKRLVQHTFYWEDRYDQEKFLKGESKMITIPGTDEKIPYDPLPRTCIGFSEIGTSEAISIGAWAYALDQLS